MSLVDWSLIPVRYKWIAQDSNGSIFAYIDKPKIVQWHGSWAGRTVEDTIKYSNGTKDVADWQNTLEERP